MEIITDIFHDNFSNGVFGKLVFEITYKISWDIELYIHGKFIDRSVDIKTI